MSHLRTLQDRARTRVGTVLKDKWQLEALLGVGGTAAIYAARHRNGKRAAIKVLHPELTSNDEVVQRFVREGYAANKLEHPGAVSVLDDDRAEDGSVFLVMELLDGVALDRYARQTGERLPLEQVLRIGDEILDVLAAAHAKGVIHRDIKPANLFLTRDGRVKVLDFGIARLREGLATDSTATQTGTSIGTPAFMPPEQARGRWSEVDARTDIWAVGASLFALICGHRPRKAETVNEELLLAMTQPVPSLGAVMPSVPRPIVEVVDRALAFDQNQRWSDARAMQLALRRAGDAIAGALVALPLTPQPDTAPVLHGVSPLAGTTMGAMTGPMDPLDARLTTSRPLVAQGSSPANARPKSNIGIAIGVFSATLVLGLAVGGIFLGSFYMRQHSTNNAAATAPSTPLVVSDPKPAVPPVNSVQTTPIAKPAMTAAVTTTPTTPSTPTATASAKPTHAGKPTQPTDQAMMNERF